MRKLLTRPIAILAAIAVGSMLFSGCVVVEKEERIVPRHGATYEWPSKTEDDG